MGADKRGRRLNISGYQRSIAVDAGSRAELYDTVPTQLFELLLPSICILVAGIGFRLVGGWKRTGAGQGVLLQHFSFFRFFPLCYVPRTCGAGHCTPSFPSGKARKGWIGRPADRIWSSELEGCRPYRFSRWGEMDKEKLNTERLLLARTWRNGL